MNIVTAEITVEPPNSLEERIEQLEREITMMHYFCRSLTEILVQRGIASWDEIKHWDEVNAE